MVEELTTQVMMSSMLLIIVTAPVLTFLLSVILLWLYRRKVTLAMTSTGGFDAQSWGDHGQESQQLSREVEGRESTWTEVSDLYRLAIRAPWRHGLRFSISGLLFALVFALAAHFVYPFGLELPGFLIGVWIYAWPVLLSLLLIVPESIQKWTIYIFAYCLVFMLLGVWAATITNLPEYRFGGFYLPARSSVTPVVMAKFWLVVNAAPTLLVWFCSNRWIRAVAPQVLAFVVIAITGMWLFYVFVLYSESGVDTVVALSVSMDVHIYWFLLAAFILSLLASGVPGLFLIRWIGQAYRQRWLSDQSLTLDALWLLFASFYGMWLVRGGMMWIAAAPVAFLVYRTALEVIARVQGRRSNSASGLIFLRVFSLGRRSDSLLNAVSRYWRYLGSVQMITGPDVAKSTVQPHQFLDYLSGKLTSHFVSDHTSLTRRLEERNQTPDPDSRYRINNFFCHEDSWKTALLELVKGGDIVLMDLRSFSAANAGCIHELRLLIREVPVHRFMLVVDDTTDKVFLENNIREFLQELIPGTPNRDRKIEEMNIFHFKPGLPPLRRLIHRLCLAACR